MATLFITVFRSAGSTAHNNPSQEEVVDIGVASAQSNAITGARGRRTVRLYPDADCFVTWGPNPTALIDGTEGRAMGQDNPEYFNISVGDIIATIQRV